MTRPAPTDADGWALLDALRRKLDDQAAQGRRTHDQVQQLADSIGALVAAQRKRSRWLNLNSFVAYVLFTILCGTAAVALYQRRAGELVGERDKAVAERDQMAKQADELAAAAKQQAELDGRAVDIWQTTDTNRARAEYGKLANAPLSKLARLALDARVKDAPPPDPEAPYKAAVSAFKAGRYGEARGPFEATLAAEPTGKHAAALHYYLGVIDAKDGKLPDAIAHLDAALAGDVAEDDARFQLAAALDRAGDFPKAKAAYDQFAAAHPKMRLAVYAVQRSAALAKIVAPPAPVAPPKPAAPAPAPAQDPPPAPADPAQ